MLKRLKSVSMLLFLMGAAGLREPAASSGGEIIPCNGGG